MRVQVADHSGIADSRTVSGRGCDAGDRARELGPRPSALRQVAPEASESGHFATFAGVCVGQDDAPAADSQ